jgi:putative transposase
LSTKIHALTDTCGLPLALEFTPGQRHEAPVAPALIAKTDGGVFIGDMAYDSKEIRDLLLARGITPIIPSNPTRKEKADYDKEKYKERHAIENFFANLKQSRRIATRYDKTIESYAGFTYIACALIWAHVWI